MEKNEKKVQTKKFKLGANLLMQKLYRENIPKEMQSLRNWVAFDSEESADKPGKFTKVLYDPNRYGIKQWAKSNEPQTWSSFEQAIDYAVTHRCTGVAFALQKELNICCIDLDGCIDDGKINVNAQNVWNEFGDTYCEKSISGRGLHIFCKGNLPKDYVKRNDVIEMYDDVRFISMTGNLFKYSKNSLNEVHNLSEINKKYLGEFREIKTQISTDLLSLDEKFIVDKLNYNTKYGALFRGDTSRYNNDSSRADLALCMGIAFYTKDENVMDNVFRQSGLYRDKWDKGNYAKITMRKAIEFQKNTYNPKSYYETTNNDKKPQRTAMRLFEIERY